MAMKSEDLVVRALLETLNEGVAMFDKEKQVVFVNSAFIQMAGLSKEGLYVSDLSRLFQGQKVNLEEKLEEALTTGRATYVAEVSLASFFYEMFITAVKGPKGRIEGGAITLHDITQRKKVSRMESEFISIASHQLRTPMTGIQWVVERFMRKEKVSERGRGYLKDIHMSVRRLTALVDLLLNVSRIEGGRVGISPEPLELIGFLRGYMDECDPMLAKKNLTLVFEKHPEALKVITDGSALRNIVQSLVSNAIEYTPKDGRIEVAVEKLKDAFRIVVADTGIGIPKQAQATIFKKFTRAKNAQLVKTDGTGLGLYIAKQAVDLLGGNIWLESEVNKGTTFFVELPTEAKEKAGEKKLA
jgi:two-component system, OmpR family, phosphate regulon sensor histidine kinase PhoR